MLTKDYRSISENDFNALLDSLKVVVITVTPIETEALHEKLEPLFGNAEILVFQKHILTYYIGVFGAYVVCHVESRMGSIGAGASIMTTQLAIELIKPTMVIMVGIAFGVDETEQNIGDVLISEQIVQYESKKVKAGQTQWRGFKQMSSVLLFNRFTKPIGWKFEIAENVFSKLVAGNMLSGEVLIDDLDYRQELVRVFAPVVGGEMEGTGLVSAAHSYNKHWIVIKGICDYADGHKGEAKVDRQYLAARAAVDLCLTVFNDKFTFRDIDVVPFSDKVYINAVKNDNEDKNEKVDIGILLDVAFNSYSINKEPYYILRQIDELYNGFIESEAHIWSFGKSGVGKTCATFRNLIQSGKKICVIDLSMGDSSDLLELFDYIYFKVAEKAGIRKQEKATNIMHSLDNICHCINEHLGKYYIIFEEIPISVTETKVAEYLFSLIIKNDILYPDSTTRFAFTSIGSPEDYVPRLAEKVGEKIFFLELALWSYSDMSLLLERMLLAVNCKLDESYKEALINVSKYSPRNLKTNLRNLVMFAQGKRESFETMVAKHFKEKYNYVK
jgi:nucleoside phosphorylase